MSHQPKYLYEFASFRLDVAEYFLLRDGDAVTLLTNHQTERFSNRTNWQPVSKGESPK